MRIKPTHRNLLITFMVWFAVLVVVGYISLSLSSFSNQSARYVSDPPFYRWDSNWYISIADGGYFFTPNKNSNIAFFPAYPALIWLGNLLTGIRMSWMGFYLSFFFAFGSFYMLYKLLVLDYSKKKSSKIILVWLLYPFSFYLISVYSESLFIFLEILSLYLARKRKWSQASTVASVAVLTRPYGIFLVPVLVWEYCLQQNKKNEVALKDLVKIVLLPITTFAGFIAYCAIKFQEPFAFIMVQKSWGRELTSPLSVILAYIHQVIQPNIFSISNLHYLINLFVVLSSIGILFFSIKKVRSSYLVLSVLLLLPTLFSGTFTSAHRYALAIFPLFIVPALFLQKNKFIFSAYIAVSTLLLIYFASLFVRWAPIF